MPSTERAWQAAGAVVTALVLAYAALVSGQLLLGLLTAGLAYLAAWTLGRVGPRTVVARMGRPWAAVTGLLALAPLGYGAVVVGAPLLGLFVALLVAHAAWLVAPDGPLVRAVRWVLAARADLRAIREAVEGERQSADD
jgi:hypothetical protein